MFMYTFINNYDLYVLHHFVIIVFGFEQWYLHKYAKLRYFKYLHRAGPTFFRVGEM